MTTVNETPTFAKVLQQAIETRVCEIHTAMPGRIVSYDSSKQTATVQPEFKRKFINGELVDIPPITGVPVVMPRAGKSFISLPLNAGDSVLIVFSERSLEKWKKNGGTVDPSGENRKHDYSDAYAIPGGYPTSKAAKMDSKNLLIVNDKAKITLDGGGKFKLEKDGGDEIIDLLVQVIDTLSTTTTNTMLGPMQLNDFAKFAELKGKLEALKG